MAKFLELVASNKIEAAIVALLTSIFTTALGYSVQQEYTSDEQFAEIRKLTTSMEEQKAGLVHAQEAIDIHDKVMTEITTAAITLNQSLTADALSPPNLVKTTQLVIDTNSTARTRLAAGTAKIGSVYFDDPALKDLQTKLLLDLGQADKSASDTTNFLRTILTDFKTAREQAPLIRENLDGKRYEYEANARKSAIDVLFEKVRRNYNDEVARANAQLSMYRSRSRLALAAWAYIGAYVGGMSVWFTSRIRRRRDQEANLAEFSE
jgi:hypothetical protein